MVMPLPGDTLIVGIEPDPNPKWTRIYVGRRSARTYILMGEDGTRAIRREWGRVQHLYTKLPSDIEVLTEEQDKVTYWMGGNHHSQAYIDPSTGRGTNKHSDRDVIVAWDHELDEWVEVESLEQISYEHDYPSGTKCIHCDHGAIEGDPDRRKMCTPHLKEGKDAWLATHD